jgi:hypothetical protein
LYRILLLYVAQARAGSDTQNGLEQATMGLDLMEWPGPIVSMYLGKVPDHIVFDAVADADPIRERQKRCQAYFYVGQRLLIRQKNSEAAKMFRQTVATNASTLSNTRSADRTRTSWKLTIVQKAAIAKRFSAESSFEPSIRPYYSKFAKHPSSSRTRGFELRGLAS